MPGTIRTKLKCPICGKTFQEMKNIGFICPEHKTTPNRFFIDVFYDKRRIKLYSNKTGHVLDSYSLANETLLHIQYELRHHVFDPSKYVISEVQQFWISTLLDRFLAHKMKTIAPSYVADYRRMTDIAKCYFGDSDIRELRKLKLINYKDHLETDYKISSKTLKNILDHFKTFLYFCKNDLEIISTVPAFPEVETTEYEYKWLSNDDQIALFEMIPDCDKPIFAFLMLSGCRPGEARALKCKNVDLKNATIKISATFSGKEYREKRKGKRSKAVVIPIHPELYEFISDRVKNNLPEAWLFVNPRTQTYYSHWSLDRAWRDVCTAKGIQGVRLYDATRHSFASQLVDADVALLKVSRLMGHSTIKMTEKYVHHRVEGLKADLNKLSLKRVPSLVKESRSA